MIALHFALSREGELVSALTAPQGMKYLCLQCGGHLHVKRGQQRRAHFAHDPRDTSGCAGESVVHLAAKRLLLGQLKQELQADSLVRWAQHCPGVRGGCRMRSVLPLTHEVEPDWEVNEEVTHGRYRFDVAVTVRGRVADYPSKLLRAAKSQPR